MADLDRKTAAVPAQRSPRLQGASKRSLLVLSHAMERAFDAGLPSGPSLVLAAFQRRAYFDVEAARYARLAARGAVVVVAFAGDVEGLPPGVHGVPLREDEALAREWALVLLEADLGACLVAVDEGDLLLGERTLEGSRRFSGRWSFARADAAGEARRLLAALRPALPTDVLARAVDVVEVAAAAPETPAERRLSTATRVLVDGLLADARRTARLRQEVDLQRTAAEHDQLTGLPNRRYLERFLRSSGATRLQLGVLLADLDGLKAVNDGRGHKAGDAAICAAARAIRDTCRQGDVVVRWGGDEFLVLLPGLDEAAVADVGQRVVEAVRGAQPPAPFADVRLSVSVGACVTRPQALPLERLDAALHRAKASGKDALWFAPS